jgi:hypothetical protein
LGHAVTRDRGNLSATLLWVIRVDFALPVICPLSGPSRTCQFDVGHASQDEIDALFD